MIDGQEKIKFLLQKFEFYEAPVMHGVAAT